MTTPTPGSLAAALASVQANLPEVTKGETAKIEKKTGGYYKYTYADLSAVTRAILPLLGAAGLAWTTKPTLRADGRFVLEYKLLHVSGESETGEYPLSDRGSPQDIGSAITYARRYALCSVTGIAPDDDDDAAQATAGYNQRRTETPQFARPTSDKERIPAPMTDSQRNEMFALFKKLNRENRDDQLTYLSWIAEREVSSRKDLTGDETRRAISDLRRRVKEMKIEEDILHSGPEPHGEQAAHDLR